MTARIVATDVVRMYLQTDILCLEELIDLAHEQLDLIESGEKWARTTT